MSGIENRPSLGQTVEYQSSTDLKIIATRQLIGTESQPNLISRTLAKLRNKSTLKQR